MIGRRYAARLEREKKTVRAMIEIACKERHHPPEGLCIDCTSLLEYALQRIEVCPYGREKPVCSRCPIHCYRPERREQIRAVMRYAGPRMLLRHPVLTLLHIIDEHILPPGGSVSKTKR